MAATDDVTNRHPFLYHYTSEVGFRGIVESNALWATYFGDLNDAKEIHELRVPLVEELTTWFIPLIKDFRKSGFRADQTVSKAGGNVQAATKIARTWVNALYRTTFEGDESVLQGLCCIASFCSHEGDQPYEREHGLLSQWRGYGGAGGYCIVFDTAKLQKLLEIERRSNFYLFTNLLPAFYFMERAPVTTLFSDLLSFSKEIVGSAMSGDTSFSSEKVFVPFVSSATTTKHRGFYEEREVRLIAMAATQLADEKIKDLPGYKPEPIKAVIKTDKEGRSRQHIILFGKEFDRLPITRIIVGPSRAQEDNFKLAKEVVGKKIPVTKSETPFVG